MVRKLILFFLFFATLLWGLWQLFNLLLTPPKDLQPPKLSTPSQQTVPVKGKQPPSTESLQKQARQGIDYINQLRQAVGLNTLSENEALNNAAYHHALYSVENDFQGHIESANKPYFTGQTPIERAFSSGFPTSVNEVVSYNRSKPELYVDDLMSAIYHRLSLLKMNIDLIGAGIAQDNQGMVKSTFTALTSNQMQVTLCSQQRPPKPGELFYKDLCAHEIKMPVKAFKKANSAIAIHNPKMLVWPKDGSTVPPVFYEENPDPLPECNVSGYPPHIQINPVYQGRIQFVKNSFKLYEIVHGQLLPVNPVHAFNNLTDPHQSLDQHTTPKHEWYAFFPAIRLNWGSRYQAEVKYRENGHIHTKRWTFLTEKQPGLVIFKSSKGNKTPLPVKVGETKTFYFQPTTCNAPKTSEVETLSALHVDLEKTFIDGQTFQIRIQQARKGDQVKLRYAPTNTVVTLRVE